MDEEQDVYENFSEVAKIIVAPILDRELDKWQNKEVLANEEIIFSLISDLKAQTGHSVYHSLLDIKGPDNRGEVCPLSLLLGRSINNISIDDLIDWESASENYHQLPFSGSWLDQPKWVTQAMDHIRAGKNAAKNDINDDLMKSSKSGGAKKHGR